VLWHGWERGVEKWEHEEERERESERESEREKAKYENWKLNSALKYVEKDADLGSKTVGENGLELGLVESGLREHGEWGLPFE
jgi:hypothetical protein